MLHQRRTFPRNAMQSAALTRTKMTRTDDCMHKYLLGTVVQIVINIMGIINRWQIN